MTEAKRRFFQSRGCDGFYPIAGGHAAGLVRVHIDLLMVLPD